MTGTEDGFNDCEAKTQKWLEEHQQIFSMYIAGKSYDEIKLNEDLYSVNAHSAFAELCESELDMHNMRLDLFF